MQELAASGVTAIFVSHELALIESLCERVLWIDDGGLRQDGARQRC